MQKKRKRQIDGDSNNWKNEFFWILYPLSNDIIYGKLKNLKLAFFQPTPATAQQVTDTNTFP